MCGRRTREGGEVEDADEKEVEEVGLEEVKLEGRAGGAGRLGNSRKVGCVGQKPVVVELER